MPSAHQLNVSLTAELDEFVRTRVESGMYATSSEVVREGLRLLQQREREAEESLDVIRKKLEQAAVEADRGEFVDSETVFGKLDAIIERHRKARAAKTS